MFQFVKKGIHPPGNKNTSDSPTTIVNSFRKVRIPLSMHIGAPCDCLVSAGDEVLVGQKIGDSASYVSAPVHSSVSGKVITVKRMDSGYGPAADAVEIESDGLFRLHGSIVPPAINDRGSFISAIRESGLVGLGGACFPTHVKINPPQGKEPDILIINAAECEPYITSDYRVCIEHPDNIIQGITEVIKWLSIPSAIIGIEDNKMEAVRILQSQIDKQGKQAVISIKVLKTIYPQGAEKPLIYSVTGRKVPAGGLPNDVRTLVLNVSTIQFIASYLLTGMPLVRKNITLDGGAFAAPCNVNVPIGALISDIIDAAGGFKEDPTKVIMGGPMMGVAIDRLDIGIIKANNAILAFDAREAFIPPEYPCIRCSRCVSACPMELLPTTLDFMTRINDLEGLKKCNVADCIECGCCTYVCPSKRYLVQSIRTGKSKSLAAAKTEVKA